MCPRLPDFPYRCTEAEPIQWRDDAQGASGTHCPVLLLQSGGYHYARGWEMLERGILPAPGGWANQDALWAQAFDAIGAVVAQVREELRQPHDGDRE